MKVSLMAFAVLFKILSAYCALLWHKGRFVMKKILIVTFYGTSQCAERILNKTAKAINETFAGLKLMLQGFRIYFV